MPDDFDREFDEIVHREFDETVPLVVRDRIEADRIIALGLHPAGGVLYLPPDPPGVQPARAIAIATEVAALPHSQVLSVAYVLGIIDEAMAEMTLDDARAALIVRTREHGLIDTLAEILHIDP